MNNTEYIEVICKEIIKESMKHPELRFIQLLWDLKIIDRDNQGTIRDRFYEPSEATLKRILNVDKPIEIQRDNKLYASNPYQEEVRKTNMEYATICYNQQKEIEALRAKCKEEKNRADAFANHIFTIKESWEEFRKLTLQNKVKTLEAMVEELNGRK